MQNECESTGEPEQLAERLRGGRPVPAAGFRGSLARHLARDDPGYGPRPPRLRLIVAAHLGGGVLLLGSAALVGLGVL